jgi:hypothetical protein
MKENIEGQVGEKWPTGLNNLLNSPNLIVGLPPVNFKPELTSPALWAEMYAVNGLVEKIVDQSKRFDSTSKTDIYTVEVGADNGVLMAYRNIGDETRTTTIYMSAHGKELSDWGKGLAIAEDRVKCKQIKVVSRKQISPNIFTASQFIYRVSPDFSLIEGDPEKSDDLKSLGMLGDGETFFFDSMTRGHVMFIEVYDPVTDSKTLAPLIADAKDLWRLTENSTRGEIFWRLLKGNPNDVEREMVDSAIVDMGGKFVIDISRIKEIGMKITNDIIAQADATLKPVPMNAEYLRDLRKNLSNSRPEPIGSEVSIAQTFDGLGLAKKKYLEKRAAKKLGGFT